MTMITRDFESRAYTIKELAKAYRTSRTTFRRWLKIIEKDIGPRNLGHFYSPRQVKIIVEILGEP